MCYYEHVKRSTSEAEFKKDFLYSTRNKQTNLYEANLIKPCFVNTVVNIRVWSD